MGLRRRAMRPVTVDIVSTPSALIPLGLIPEVSSINKFGRNPEIDTATAPEDIWDTGGLWVPPTAPRIHNLVSSSVEDEGTLLSSGTATSGTISSLIDENATFSSDGVAKGDAVLNDTNIDHSLVVSVDSETQLTLENSHHGNQKGSVGFNTNNAYRVVTTAQTGASVVHVYGLDENLDELEEFIILDGTTNVPTVNTYWRIYRMHIDGAVSRIASNIGNLTATAATDATVQSTISAGLGQSLQAIYTIPRGKTGLLTHFSATILKTAVGAFANMTIKQTKFAKQGTAGSVTEHFFSLSTSGSSHVSHHFNPHKVFEEQTDVWIRCESVSANTTAITAAFDIILIDN